MTLGGAAINVRGTSDSVVEGGKGLALLTYLEATRHRSATREELLDLLWSDTDPLRARNSLRQLVYSIRRRLGADVLDGSDDVIRLGSTVTSDRRELSEAISNGEAAAVVAAYTGPFLDAYAQPGAHRFEEWAAIERSRLRGAFLRAAEALVREAHRRGRPADAVALAQRMRDEDPDRESTWRLLLETLGAAGDWLALPSEQEALLSRLALEGRDPEAATAALLRRLRDPVPQVQTSDGTALTAELVGRDSEFARLLGAWAQASGGRKTSVALRGIAGFGKSRLLAEVRGRLRARGARVVMVRARGAEYDVSWAFLADLVETLGKLPGAAAVPPAVVPDLVALVPTLRDQFPHAAPAPFTGELLRRRGTALLALLDTIVQEAPTALLLDDLHWCDEASGQCLHLALERIDGNRPLLCVLSSRPQSRDLGAGTDSAIVLRGLSRGEIEGAMESIAAFPEKAESRILIDAVEAGSGGNPQLILAMLQDLLNAGTLGIVDGTWVIREEIHSDRGGLGNAGTLRTLTSLSAPLRRTLETLAFADCPLSLDVLAHALGAGVTRAEQDLDALVGRGLAIHDGAGWEVAHDLVAEVVRGHASSPADYHSRLCAALLAGAREDPGMFRRAAQHARAAADPALMMSVGAAVESFAREASDSRPLGDVAADLLRVSRHDPILAQVLSGRSWLRRIGRRRRRVVGAVAVLTLLGGAVAAEVRSTLVLVVESLPTNPLTPAPVVERHGLRSRLLSDRSDSIRVIKVSGPGELLGQRVRPVVGGRAQFSELGVTEPGTYVLEFASDGFRPVRTRAIEVGRGLEPRVRITAGVVGNRAVAQEEAVVAVSAGALLDGWLEVEYRAPWTAASVMLCGAISWRPPRDGYWTFFPLPTPARDLTRRVSLDAFGLRAPTTPGDHYLILAQNAEPGCQWVMSLTNWDQGLPRWDDNNELLDHAIRRLGAVRSEGSISAPIRRNTREHGPGGLAETPIGIAVLTVRVEGH